MRILPILYILLLFTNQLSAQEVIGGFNLDCNKRAWSQVHELDNSELLYSFYEGKYLNIIKVNSELETKDADVVDLNKYKVAKIFGLAHSKKNSVLFFTKRDSNFLFAMTYNRIGERQVQHKNPINLAKLSYLNSFQVNNQYYLLFNNISTKKLIVIQLAIDDGEFKTSEIELSYLKEWESSLKSNPFSACQIIKPNIAIDAKQGYSKIKIYIQNDGFALTYDNNFYKTEYLHFNQSNDLIKTFSYNSSILNKGSLSGAKYTSIIVDNKLYSAVANNSGISLSEFSLITGKNNDAVYIDYYNDKLLMQCNKENQDLTYRTKQVEPIDIDIKDFENFGLGYIKEKNDLNFNFALFNFTKPNQNQSPILIANKQKLTKELEQYSTISNPLSVLHYQAITTTGLILNTNFNTKTKSFQPLSSASTTPCCVKNATCYNLLYQRATEAYCPTLIFYKDKLIFGFYKPRDNQYLLIDLQ